MQKNKQTLKEDVCNEKCSCDSKQKLEEDTCNSICSCGSNESRDKKPLWKQKNY